MDCSMPGFLVHHQLPELTKLMYIGSVMPSTISCSLILFSSCPESFPPSESFPMSQFFFHIKWPKLSFSISPSNEYSGLLSCQEPPREIPPMTRSCGRELLSKASELNWLPRLSRTSTPKPESVCFTISWLSPTPLTLTGGYSWPPFSGENQLRAIANKSPGHEKNISNQNPSVSILACLADIPRLLQLHMWLFSQLWEARKA